MKGRRKVCKFYKISEVFDACIPSTIVKIADEWWAVSWRKYRRVFRNTDRPGFVSGMLNEFGRCIRRDDFTKHPTLEANSFTLDRGSSLFPYFYRFGVVAKFNSDFFQNQVGIALNQFQSLDRCHFVCRYFAFDISDTFSLHTRTFCKSCGSAACSRSSRVHCYGIRVGGLDKVISSWSYGKI